MLLIRKPCVIISALAAATEVAATAQRPWVMYTDYAASVALLCTPNTVPVSAI